MGATVNHHSLTSRGSAAAAVPSACASSSGVIITYPACLAKPTAAIAKEPKQARSFQEGDLPVKRARLACAKVEPDATTKIKTRRRPSRDEDRSPLGSLRNGVQALCVSKNQASASPIRLPKVVAPPKPPAGTMGELLERARLAKTRSDASSADADAVHRREIQRRRAVARREREKMVRTVEFNDPFIDVQDVFK